MFRFGAIHIGSLMVLSIGYLETKLGEFCIKITHCSHWNLVPSHRYFNLQFPFFMLVWCWSVDIFTWISWFKAIGKYLSCDHQGLSTPKTCTDVACGHCLTAELKVCTFVKPIYNTVISCAKYSQNTLHSLHMRARYGTFLRDDILIGISHLFLSYW